jgi:hypothetical protein
VDDLRVVDSAQIYGGDSLVGVLALDDAERYAFAGHLDRVRMAELVRSEPSPNSGGDCGVAKLDPDSGRGARSSASGTAKDAEALSLAETDRDPVRGAILVRRGLCRTRHKRDEQSWDDPPVRCS